MANNTVSSNINKDILVRDLGLKQFKNTTIYTKNSVFVISPSSQNSYSWFDLRRVNLERYNSTKERGHLVVRFQDTLLWGDLDQFIASSISEESSVYTPSIGVHWKFNVFEQNGEYATINRTGKQRYKLIKMSVEQLQSVVV